MGGLLQDSNMAAEGRIVTIVNATKQKISFALYSYSEFYDKYLS